jgi:hypothetical protein
LLKTANENDGRVDGLVTSDKEVRRLTLNFEVWRGRGKMIVAAKLVKEKSIVKLGKVKLEVLLLLFSIVSLSTEIFFPDSL